MRTAVFDQMLIAVLLLASGAFAVAVWLAQPATVPVARNVTAVAPHAQTVSLANVARGAVLHPLSLPGKIDGVDLGAMSDRLANEAAPAAWQRVVTVRGTLGVASVNGPAVVAWTEGGIAYWLTSPTKTIDELLQIASDLR